MMKPDDPHVKAIRELGRAAADDPKAAYAAYQREKEWNELIEVLEDMDVAELEDVRGLIDEIIEAKSAVKET